jgi:hypothetical protein
MDLFSDSQIMEITKVLNGLPVGTPIQVSVPFISGGQELARYEFRAYFDKEIYTKSGGNATKLRFQQISPEPDIKLY